MKPLLTRTCLFCALLFLPIHVCLSAPGGSFIWSNAEGAGRNEFAHFRLVVRLTTQPASASLKLFADTRYRLRVNGAVVACGPAAFLVKHPEFDTVELAKLLHPGENEITVEANARNESSFQAEPSRGGFIAWGEARDADGTLLADFSTPGAWQTRRAEAWKAQAPTYSFAQGPVEIADLKLLPPDGRMVDASATGWHTPVLVAAPLPWGSLAPRSVPMPSLELWEPKAIVTLAPLASREHYVSATKRFFTPELPLGAPSYRFAYACWLHSSSARTVPLSLTPGEHWVNGAPLKVKTASLTLARRTAQVTLKSGWNLLYGETSVRNRSWGIAVGWPRSAGLRVAAQPDGTDHAAHLRLTPAMPPDELLMRRGAVPISAADLARFGDLLQAASGDLAAEFPAREFGWDEPLPLPVKEPTRIAGRKIPLSAAGEGTAVLDFGREFIGHVVLEIDAPAGGVLDVANDELLRADGAIRIFSSNQLINSVDRLHLRPGLNHWEGFHARGGRYVQLTARSSGPVTIRRAALRSALVPVPESGKFTCSDPIFNWAWNAGVETLRASLTDGWVDPWREQGIYIGDSYVEYLAHRTWTRDNSHIVRALRLWARSQLPDGQLQAVAPSWFRRPHPDYTLIWIMLLRDYARATGDRALVNELWPCVERIWQSSVWSPDANGLWTAEGLRVFGDWGASEASIKGDANALLNAFRVGALEASAQLAEIRGDKNRAATFLRERTSVVEAYRRILWNPETKAFIPSLRNGQTVDTSAAHANALALLYRIAAPEQEAGALAIVRQTLATASAAPEKCIQRGGHYELYFLHFVLEMFANRGLYAEAETTIRQFWGLQRNAGAWTLWEAFHRGQTANGSQCHGWACGPSVYFHRTVLGIEATPERITIVPTAVGLTQASGLYPHPRGDIAVSWRVEGNEFYLEADLPEGIPYEVRPGATFAHLHANITIRTHPAR